MQLKPSPHPTHQSSSSSSSPPKRLTPSSSILIIGSGTWGISTALHLARRSYTNINVLDTYPIPSPISAGNDINKILELSSSAPLGTTERIVADQLARDAIHGWRTDAVFTGLFHETGAICAASSEAGKAALNSGGEDGYSERNGWERVEGKDAFRALMPKGVLTGEFPGWSGWARKDGCGWVEARNALVRAGREAEKLGVRFVSGERGRVLSLLYDEEDDDGGRDVRGAVVANGPAWRADRVVLCAGANAAELMDLRDQLRPTAWTLAHIQLTEHEAQLYKDLPVLFNIERGFFMEPDAERRELKICDEHPGYCNWETSPAGKKDRSVPFAYRQIPREAEERVRKFLRETMPQLAERPFSFARICWCADTVDRAFLISRHPEHASLVLGVGGSGHGFSYIPAIGGVIADCLEGKMDPHMEERFRWRPEMAEGRDWTDLQDRHGPPGSNHVMDFQDVKEWTSIADRG